jgi:RNA polymerase sigma factor (sigma-70 family)
VTTHCEIAEVVARAREGDQQAWSELVRRYAALVWAVAREHRLSRADAADASQNTWIALAENLGSLREPKRIAGWLATTARRECLRIHAAHRRELPAEWLDEPVPGPEPTVLRAARDQVLWQAVAALSESCRRLLRLYAHAPELTYADLCAAVGLAEGSIGPTKGRCLKQLRRKLAILDVREESAG